MWTKRLCERGKNDGMGRQEYRENGSQLGSPFAVWWGVLERRRCVVVRGGGLVHNDTSSLSLTMAELWREATAGAGLAITSPAHSGSKEMIR